VTIAAGDHRMPEGHAARRGYVESGRGERRRGHTFQLIVRIVGGGSAAPRLVRSA